MYKKAMLLALLALFLLTAAHHWGVRRAVTLVPNTVVQDRLTGCWLNHEPKQDPQWRVYDSADAEVFAGGESAATEYLLFDCQ